MLFGALKASMEKDQGQPLDFSNTPAPPYPGYPENYNVGVYGGAPTQAGKPWRTSSTDFILSYKFLISKILFFHYISYYIKCIWWVLLFYVLIFFMDNVFFLYQLIITAHNNLKQVCFSPYTTACFKQLLLFKCKLNLFLLCQQLI